MPLKIIHQSYIELVGDGHVIVAMPYSGAADSGHDVGQIVEDAALVARCYALIGKAPKENPDPNIAEASQEGFRRRLLEIVEENRLRYVFYVVGKEETGIEVLSAPGEDASGIEELVASRFSKNFDVKLAGENEPPRSIGGADSGRLIQPHVGNAVHIRLGYDERTKRRDTLVNTIAEIVTLANSRLAGEKFEKEDSEQGC